MSEAVMPVGLVRNELELQINAPRAKVWKSMIEDVGAWWPGDFYFTKQPHRMTIEPRLGGRWQEVAEDGSGLVWGEVIAIVPGESITLGGPHAPPYAGPAYSTLHLGLTEGTDGRTLFKLSNSVFGHIHDGMKKSLDDGWKLLFDAGLRAYCESA